MKKRINGKPLKSIAQEIADSNTYNGTEKFTFSNGDTYEGGYKFNTRQLTLLKQGYGTYKTDDFNVYAGNWENDKIIDDKAHIRYNNGSEYNGGIDSNGAMNGSGTFLFPDGSLIQAIWMENKPFKDIIYKEPRGFPWIAEIISETIISFIPANHFWNEIENNEQLNESPNELKGDKNKPQ